MLAKQIHVGGTYQAKVSGKTTTVIVLTIQKFDAFEQTVTRYKVRNLATGRETTFRSASRFRTATGETEKLLLYRFPHEFERSGSVGVLCKCNQLASADIHDLTEKPKGKEEPKRWGDPR